MAQAMLSLITNPYDPFVQYGLWSRFDMQEGFNTEGLLARAVSTSDSIGEPDQEDAVEAAIESILQNPSFAGLYKRVERTPGSVAL